MKRKSTEQRLRVEKPRSVPLRALLVHSVAVQGCLSSRLAAAQLPSPFTRVNSQPSVNKFSGLCFSSGKPGHWRAACSNTPFAATFLSDESGEIPKIMV